MSHDFEPKKRYSHEGIYDISLISISKDGCRDTMLQKSALEVSDVYNVRYPNVFMPIKSGPQGGTYNDGDTHIFYPLIDRSMLKTYRLTIFDRWGLMVFETRDVSVGWDGYYNGKLCQQGVYVWKVHAEFEDGNEVVKTGDVTLLK
jgi:gliding motility-associated-like protein